MLDILFQKWYNLREVKGRATAPTKKIKKIKKTMQKRLTRLSNLWYNILVNKRDNPLKK